MVPSRSPITTPPKNGFEFVLQRVERVHRGGMFHPLADIENGRRQLAGLLRRDPGHLGVERGEQRADDAEHGDAEIGEVAVAVDERFGVVVDVVGGALVRDDEGVLVGRWPARSWRRSRSPAQARPCSRRSPARDSPQSRSTAWTARPAAIAARPYRCLPRESPAWRTACRPTAFPRSRPGCLPTSAFDSLISFRVNPPRLAFCSIALVPQHPGGRRNGDHRAIAARRQQFIEGRIRRRHLEPRSGGGIVGDFEQRADQGRAAVGVGHHAQSSFSSAPRAI